MKRKSLICLLLVMCFLSSMGTVFAAEPETPVEPDPIEPYVGLKSANGTISISSSGIATCKGKVTLYAGYTAEVTVTLQRKSGSIWYDYANWSGSGSSPVVVSNSTSSSIPSGYQYRTYVYVEVYDSNNNYVESAEAWSSVKSYP